MEREELESVFVKNNSIHVHVINDLPTTLGSKKMGKVWRGVNDPRGDDVQSVSLAEFRHSAGIRQFINTPLEDGSGRMTFEEMKVDDIDAYYREKYNKKGNSPVELAVADSIDSVLVEAYCMGVNAENGQSCNRTVHIAMDGKEMPLCFDHKDQVDKCEWHKKHNIWVGMRVKESNMLGIKDEDIDENQNLDLLEDGLFDDLEKLRNQQY